MPNCFPMCSRWSAVFRPAFTLAVVGCLVGLPGLTSAQTSTIQPATVEMTTAESSTIVVGAGSYTTVRPEPIQPLPEAIFRTDEVDGPMVTNQWWSSLVWQAFSQPLFAHPLALRCDTDGLVVTYSGSRIHGNDTGIFGGGDIWKGDLRIGHTATETFTQADCGGYSDWFVTAVFEEGAASLRTSFGHGSPFVYGLVEGGSPRISFQNPPRIWSGGAGDAVIGLTSNGHHYGLFGPSGSRWTGLDTTEAVNESDGSSYFSIAVLPDDQPETLARFARYAHAHVTDTRLEYQIVDGWIESTYRFICTPREGDETETIFALYPHQWRYTQTELDDDRFGYGSVRGQMKVGTGDQFATRVPVQGVLPRLPQLPEDAIDDRARMLAYLQAEADKPQRDFADTYWEGKHLGILASLSGVAEAVDAHELREAFLTEIQRRLEAWFTVIEGEDAPVFYYDANWGTLVGSRPSYGSDRDLNDHHFHYGYFIRAAGEVARWDPAWAERWGPMVELLIRDIASMDRDDPMFPHRRCFDAYAGHSWASGHANFGDGNNQESSSESLNAWYGMMLWGAATGNDAIRDTGAFLFNTERTAVEEYWFDVTGTNYPEGFSEVALGMVWGGKGAFATWFSGDIDCIHGINWLPFTPASLYMGRHPDYVQRNFDRIVERREGGTDFETGWGDLVVMFGALHDPESALAYIDANPQCSIEGGNSHAFMLHWIQTLHRFGGVDPAVTADHLFATAFEKEGVRTYAAFNHGSESIVVTYSDGKELQVPAGTLVTE